MKCFALTLPKFQGLRKFAIVLSNKIFETTQCERPTKKGFEAYYHITQHFLMTTVSAKWEWVYRAADESYTMNFRVGDITIMKKRDKQRQRCMDSNDGYDDWVLQLHRNEIKCNIPYLKPDQKLPMCRSKELMERGLFEKSIVERKNLLRPCQTMENMDVEYFESRVSTRNTSVGEHVGQFRLDITFKNPTFKEFEQKRYRIILSNQNILVTFLLI